jgi:hypothetical protein
VGPDSADGAVSWRQKLKLPLCDGLHLFFSLKQVMVLPADLEAGV